MRDFLQYLEGLLDPPSIPSLASTINWHPHTFTRPQNHPEITPLKGIMSKTDPSYGTRSLKDTGDVVGTPGYMAPEQVRGTIEYIDDPIQVIARNYEKIFPTAQKFATQLLQSWLDFRNAFYNQIKESIADSFRNFFRKGTNVNHDPRAEDDEPIPPQYQKNADTMGLWARRKAQSAWEIERAERKRQPHQVEFFNAWKAIQQARPQLEKMHQAIQGVVSPEVSAIRDKFMKFWDIWSHFNQIMEKDIQKMATNFGHDLDASDNTQITGLTKNMFGGLEFDPHNTPTQHP